MFYQATQEFKIVNRIKKIIEPVNRINRGDEFKNGRSAIKIVNANTIFDNDDRCFANYNALYGRNFFQKYVKQH